MGTLSVQAWVKKTSNSSSGTIISKFGSGVSNGSNYSYSLYEVDGSDLMSLSLRRGTGASGTTFDSNSIDIEYMAPYCWCIYRFIYKNLS